MEPFEYRAPTQLQEALDALAEFGPDAKVLAGGQSLMVLLRQRLIAPRVLVSLKRIDELATIETPDPTLRLGCMVTYRVAARSPEIVTRAPILARAAGSVGSVHIRNLGTIGGSLCHADPAGDVPTVLVALGATLRVANGSGVTLHPADQFFTGLFETRLSSNEILVGIDIPPPEGSTTYGYGRFCYREGEYPMAVAACRLVWRGDLCVDARVAVGGGDLYPKRLPEVEAVLAGRGVDDSVRADVREVLPSLLRPMPDVRGSAPWKSRVAMHLVERVLEEASE